jgi:phosphate-selective porin OprO and OprP
MMSSKRVSKKMVVGICLFYLSTFAILIASPAVAAPDDKHAPEHVDSIKDDGSPSTKKLTPPDNDKKQERLPFTLASAGYKNGFFIKSADDKFKLTIQGRLQARYSYEVLQGDDENAFSLPRARLTLKGHAFHKNLKYKFHSDYGKGAVNMKDYYIDYGIVPKVLRLRVGQSKLPFSRQYINSSSRLSLVDRPITHDAFVPGRDIGFSFSNNYEKSPIFEWAFGLYNGTGDKGQLEGTVTTSSGAGEIVSGKFNNVPDVLNPAVVLRVGYNYGGIKGYSEADFEGGGLRFGLGASAVFNFDLDDDKDSSLRAQADYIVKLHGFATSGAYYTKTNQTGAGWGDQSSQAWGAYVQAGYLFDKKYHPEVRYALVDTQTAQQTEMALGFCSYYRKHSVKWQSDVAQLSTTEGTETTADYQIRTQLQVSF